MNKLILFTLPILIIGISFSCAPNVVNGGNGVTEPVLIFSDDWNTGLLNTDELYFNNGDTTVNGIENLNAFQTAIVDGGRTNPDGKVVQLDFSLLKAGGSNGVNAQFKSNQDLSKYNALTFWAKAEADGQIEKIIVTNGKSDTNNIWLRRSGTATLDNTKFNVFGTEWRKVIVPIFDSSYLSDTGIAVQFIHEYNIVNAAGAKLDVDELKYEKLDNIASLVDSISYDTTTISLNTGATQEITGTLTVKLINEGAESEIVDTTNSMLNWVSADTAKVTVSGNQITAVAVGTATIEGTLNGTDKTVEIAVTVTDTSTPAGKQYLYGSELGTDDLAFSNLSDTNWTFVESYDDTLVLTEIEATGEGHGTNRYRKLSASSANASGGFGGDGADLTRVENFTFYAKQPSAAQLTTGKTAATSFNIVFEKGDGEEINTRMYTVATNWQQRVISIPENDADTTDYTQVTKMKYVLPDTNTELLMDELFIHIKSEGEGSFPYPIYTDTEAANPINVVEFPIIIVPHWMHDGGYDGTITATEPETGGVDNGPYLRLTGTNDVDRGYAAGGWGDNPIQDFSAYTELVFSAKSDSATSISFGLVDEAGAALNVEQAITSSWPATAYTIPLTDFTGVDRTKIKTIRYVLTNLTDVVDIDEVYLQ